MNTVPFLAAFVLPMASACAQVSDLALSQDRTELGFSFHGKTIKAPPTQEDQQGFMSPAVSSDGRTVGWLALTANCCTSYPVPTALVLFKNGQVRMVLKEPTPIWRWELSRDGTTVSYAVHPPYGGYVVQYFQRRVPSGSIVAKHTCDPENAEELAGKAAPAWVKRVASMCPDG